MPIDDNLDDVEAWIDGVIDEIGWEMPAGREGSTHASGANLGETAIEVAVDGMRARAIVGVGAEANGTDDDYWPENERSYRVRKYKLYGRKDPNFRTGQMLSRKSLKGNFQSTSEEVHWSYGTGEPPKNGLTEHDQTTTDIEKAGYAEGSGVEGEVKRPFFALTEKDADDILIAVESAIVDHIERKASEK